MDDRDCDRIFAMNHEGKSLAEIGEAIGQDWRKVKRILESLNKEKEYHPNTLNDSSKWPDIKARIEEIYEQNKKVFTWRVIETIGEEFNEKVISTYKSLVLLIGK